jgi:hypothetical protein
METVSNSKKVDFLRMVTKPLKGYLSSGEPYGRKARWVAELMSQGVDITHIRGVDNPVSDAMSRVHK